MEREVWTLGEAWVTIWREVSGVKFGSALLEAAYMRNLSLSERPSILRKQQPGESGATPVIDGVQNTFSLDKSYLSKAETDTISYYAHQYRIEVYGINPMYDGVTQLNDNHKLLTCTSTGKEFSAKDNDTFEQELIYNVKTVI